MPTSVTEIRKALDELAEQLDLTVREVVDLYVPDEADAPTVLKDLVEPHGDLTLHELMTRWAKSFVDETGEVTEDLTNFRFEKGNPFWTLSDLYEVRHQSQT